MRLEKMSEEIMFNGVDNCELVMLFFRTNRGYNLYTGITIGVDCGCPKLDILIIQINGKIRYLFGSERIVNTV